MDAITDFNNFPFKLSHIPFTIPISGSIRLYDGELKLVNGYLHNLTFHDGSIALIILKSTTIAIDPYAPDLSDYLKRIGCEWVMAIEP